MERCLYLANLPGGSTALDIAEQLLRQFDSVSALDVCGDAYPSPYPSFAVATFPDDAQAVAAAATLNGTQFKGRSVFARALGLCEARPNAWGVWHISHWTKSDGYQCEASAAPTRQESIDVISCVNARLLARLLREPVLLKSDQISSRLFEEIVAEIWHGFGFAVELTKRTRDGGRDVVASRSLYVDERYLIECKRPTTERRIDVRTIRELYGVTRHEGATKGVLATTSFFSREALEFVAAHRWELDARDYDGIQRWLRQYFDFAES